MSSINTVCISGNLTRDAELRATNGGSSVLRFVVAVNERRKDQQGQWSDYANFIDCVMFGNRASAVAQYLTKGLKVSVQGRLHYSSWQGKDGQRRSRVEVYVEELEFMSSRQQQGSQQGYQPAPQQYQQPAPQPAPQPSYDEEIPF